MKKNKEWAFIELGKIFPSYSETYDYPDSITVMKSELLNKVYDILAQLDEPETLSEEWLEENKCSWHKLKVDGYYIPVEKLKNRHVPERELPVIPKFVAEWIEEVKPDNSLRLAFAYIAQQKRDNYDDELAFWLEEGNSETFARAWLDGYEVEEDQKYILSINITDKASKTNYETFLNKRGIFHSMENESFNSEEFSWSEEEIKDLERGEILFEHFATKVEELEE